MRSGGQIVFVEARHWMPFGRACGKRLADCIAAHCIETEMNLLVVLGGPFERIFSHKALNLGATRLRVAQLLQTL
jgi:hypothetical protein